MALALSGYDTIEPTSAAVVPIRHIAVVGHLGHRALTHQTYLRRRLVAGLLALGALILVIVAMSALTGRGGNPASAATARPFSASAAPPVAQLAGSASATYLVQPGDTMWSIAAQLRGQQSRTSFVDALIKLNGGTSLTVGQLLRLPVQPRG
mgnify:CR=1 FL=1